VSDDRSPVSTPSAQGVDARGVHAFLDAVDAAPDIELHGLVVLRHGHRVVSGWWAPYSADRVHLLYSLSKSFTSTAAAFAIAEGLMSLDDTVLSHFPRFDADITDPRNRAVLVRHVASMASGHLGESEEEAFRLDPLEPVRGFLLEVPDRDPGTVFAYNNPSTYTLAAIVQRVSGQPLTEYLRPRLFEPLGIGEVAWAQFPAGRDLGFSGLHATTEAIAALGQLYLRRGARGGRQLLSQEWVAAATGVQVPTPDEPMADWQQGYGFQFWRSRHGYRGDGAYGQLCLVLPEHDVVVAVTGATRQVQALLDAVWEHLVPAFGATAAAGAAAGAGAGAGAAAGAGGDPGADASLARRLSRLVLPIPPGSPEPDAEVRSAWAGASFAPTGGTCSEQPSLTSVEVSVGARGWRLRLIESGSRLDADVGTDGWVVSDAAAPDGCPVPLAVGGGWVGPGVLRLQVVFLETPHHLVLTATLSSRTFEAAWATMPLGGDPLHALHAPRHAQPARSVDRTARSV